MDRTVTLTGARLSFLAPGIYDARSGSFMAGECEESMPDTAWCSQCGGFMEFDFDKPNLVCVPKRHVLLKFR
jgi:hypothetical protein